MVQPRGALIERARELDQLRMLVEETARGRGTTGLIVGPPGIGKTSLMTAARDHAKAAGLQILSARAGLLERDLAWNLVRQLFAAVITATPPQRHDLVTGAGALALPALGLSVEQPPDEAGALHGLYWLTAALGERGPMLLAVDDAQWGDSPSLRYLTYIAERIVELPALLLVTARAGEMDDVHIRALESHAAANRITPAVLTADGSAELARRELGPDAEDAFCAACHTAARGNPFVLHELLRQLERDGVTPSAENAGAVAGVTPETVRRSALLRLAALSSDARELAVTLAVLGADVELPTAAAAADLDQDTAAVAADALARAGIVGPGPRLQFVHALVREVIYEELAAHDRQRRHRRAAASLAASGADVQRAAAHLLRTPPAGDSWVVALLRQAADSSLSDGAPQPAIDFLSRALAEPPAGQERIQVLRDLSGAEALVGTAGAAAHLHEAFRAAEHTTLGAQLGLELALLLVRQGQVEQGVALGRDLLDRVPSRDDGLTLRLVAAAVTGGMLVPGLQPQLESFLAHIPDDLRGDSPEACMALSAQLAVACAGLTPVPQIAELADRALGGGVLLAALFGQELLYFNAASSLIVADRFAAAESALDDALDQAQRHGSIVGFALVSAFRCKLGHRTGAIIEGTADGWQAVRAIPVDEPHVRAYAVAFLVECLVERGELGEALTLLDEPAFRGELPDLFAFHLLRVARARARLAGGDHDEAARELLEVGDAIGPRQFGPAICPWRAYAASALWAAGGRDHARRLAEEELDRAQRTQSGWGEAVALQAVADVDSERAEECLEQALVICDEWGLGLERARSLLALGALHRRLGRRRSAADLLRQALDAGALCGALAIEERARQELLATGARPRRRRLTGIEALTFGERRVAQMAAAGMTNREIAQRLFVSLRTVETHLTHSYQKLEIDSRSGLAGALEATVLDEDVTNARSASSVSPVPAAGTAAARGAAAEGSRRAMGRG